jgi:phospholipid transport system substrate-binding protein
VLLLAFSSNAKADTAKEQLQATIDRIIQVLHTIRSRDDIGKSRKPISEILVTRFDYTAMAKETLANRWVDLKDKQAEFVAVFTDFVENSYMTTLGSYRGEKIVYDSDRVNGDIAEVDTRVVGGQGEPIRIGYKLHLNDKKQWMVYDAVIDDVSVVGNYRSQFARMLKTASLDDLIHTLRAKSGR